MMKIISASVPRYREIHVCFSDGIEGVICLSEQFKGVATSLTDPSVFATAHVIDEGYGIGFDGCEYDVCASWAYEEVTKAGAAAAA